MSMQRVYQRLGILPFLTLSLGAVIFSVVALQHIVNNAYPFDVQRLDLLRATALDQVDAAAILEAPNLEFLLVFLVVVALAASGLALPIVYLLNRRFMNVTVGPRFTVVMRQATWTGLWVAFCAWLQMNRVLGIAVAALVAVVFVLFELLLQVRARAVDSIG